MILLRILVMAFNAGVITWLIYRLLEVYNSTSVTRAAKSMILAIGIGLLLLPIVMVLGFILPTMVYFVMYPIAISLFLYLIRKSNTEGTR
ncbi:MAG: hypothetical protein K1X47_05095 [Cyclobacteriaceae bacterium]|nr:hypothetical protein [Cyclobacteriaceae bacterium]